MNAYQREKWEVENLRRRELNLPPLPLPVAPQVIYIGRSGGRRKQSVNPLVLLLCATLAVLFLCVGAAAFALGMTPVKPQLPPGYVSNPPWCPTEVPEEKCPVTPVPKEEVTFSASDWSFENATLAVVYGRPGGWGSLSDTPGTVAGASQAVALAKRYAASVDSWNGSGKGVVAVVNPVLTLQGGGYLNDAYVRALIKEAASQGVLVQFDLSMGDNDPYTMVKRVVDTYLQENILIDIDLEWCNNCTASNVNKAAAYYFSQREQRGYKTSGVFAFYSFTSAQFTRYGGSALKRQYPGGWVIPIFDGHGAWSGKIAMTDLFQRTFAKPIGVMEFYSKWGARSDYGDPGMDRGAYLRKYDPAIYACQ